MRRYKDERIEEFLKKMNCSRTCNPRVGFIVEKHDLVNLFRKWEDPPILSGTFLSYFKGHYFEMNEDFRKAKEAKKELEEKNGNEIKEYYDKEKIRKGAEKAYRKVLSTISSEESIGFIESYGIEMFKLGKK